MRRPPVSECPLTWRELYLSGRFFQHDLISASNMRTLARTRGWMLSLGRETWETWDREGALRPLAFALAPWFSGMTRTAMASDEIVFTDEFDGYRPWDELAFELHGHPTVLERYSPWQSLLFHELIDGEKADVPAAWLLNPEIVGAGSLTQLLEQQLSQWRDLHRAWEPTLKILVRLQDRYWPPIRGRVNMVIDPDTNEHYDPLEREAFDAANVLAELALTTEQVRDTYAFLASRADRFEPGDHMVLVRQMLPRVRRGKFEGHARRAQDFYDAAEMLRRFYRDLTGELLPDADLVGQGLGDSSRLDHLIERRERFFGHGPRLTADAQDGRKVLLDLGIYPHSIHVVVEGQTEQNMVCGILDNVIGPYFTEQLVFTDLHGVGNAVSIDEVVAAVLDYAERTVLILDNEGPATARVRTLIEAGQVDERNVLVMDTSFEESNFTDEELVEVAALVAAQPSDTRPAATLTLDAGVLRAHHEERLSRAAADKPGLADTLLRMAAWPDHGAVRITKPELAEGLLQLMLDDFAAASEEDRGSLYERRPLLGLVAHRVGNPMINQPLDRLSSRRRRA